MEFRNQIIFQNEQINRGEDTDHNPKILKMPHPQIRQSRERERKKRLSYKKNRRKTPAIP